MYRFLESFSNFRLALAKSAEIRKKLIFLFHGSFSLWFRFQELSFSENISESEKHFDECTFAHAAESLRAALQFRATRKFKDRIIKTLKVHIVMLEWAVKSSFLTPYTMKTVFFIWCWNIPGQISNTFLRLPMPIGFISNNQPISLSENKLFASMPSVQWYCTV